MRVLITGGAGFIASNIADAYIKAGHSVVILDNLSSGKKSNINPKAVFYKVDITDRKKVEAIFARHKIDVVNHHAAQIDVRKSVADPVFDADVNVLGALNVFEAARKSKVKKFIFASSGGTIYGECGTKPPAETVAGNPLSPYGITKHTVEFYIKFYAAIYGIKYTILRYANIYGPRQDPHGEAGVVAIFSQRMQKNEPLCIFGDGKQTRDYVFVGDVVAANLKALIRGDNEIVNIGTGKLTSVNDLFNELSRITGYKKKPVYKPARPGEILKSFLDNRKAAKVLGWKPSVSIDNGLEATVAYFLDPSSYAITGKGR